MSLGGELKRKELISARLGDVLSQLYLLSCTLKRFKDDGSPKEDRALLEFAMRAGLHKIEQSLLEVYQNFPHRFLGHVMHFLTMPWGHSIHTASDRQARACAELLMEPSETRDRLTKGVFLGNPGDGVDIVEQAFNKVCANEEARDKLKKGGIRMLNHDTIKEGLERKLISDEEAEELRDVADAVYMAIQVDYFDDLGKQKG
jgi:acyl-CoA dehydrogenase